MRELSLVATVTNLAKASQAEMQQASNKPPAKPASCCPIHSAVDHAAPMANDCVQPTQCVHRLHKLMCMLRTSQKSIPKVVCFVQVTGSDDKTWKMWHLPKGDLIMSGEGHTDWLAGVAFHPKVIPVAAAYLLCCLPSPCLTIPVFLMFFFLPWSSFATSSLSCWNPFTVLA